MESIGLNKQGDRHHPFGEAGQDIERGEAPEGLDLGHDGRVVGQGEHSAVTREKDVGDTREDEERDDHALDAAPPGTELEAVLSGEGNLLPPEVVAIDDVAADLLEEPGEEAEVDGEDCDGRRRAHRQEGKVDRGLRYEDERSVDDLHDDEEEGPEPEDPPRDAEFMDDPVAERERNDDLKQGDDGERSDNQRVHGGECFD